MRAICPDWTGRTVVCIASGPSLTEEDCELVRASGHPAIVTNTTFRMCLWADVLFAFDPKWWRIYLGEVKQTFPGRLMTTAHSVPGVETLCGASWFRQFTTSGACAVSLAICGGASKVVLLGYDCQRTGGRTHWHGDHPQALSNAKTIDRWPAAFKAVAAEARARAVPAVNASRETALTCFDRVELASAL